MAHLDFIVGEVALAWPMHSAAEGGQLFRDFVLGGEHLTMDSDTMHNLAEALEAMVRTYPGELAVELVDVQENPQGFTHHLTIHDDDWQAPRGWALTVTGAAESLS